ncbi:hypothetical protein GWI33_007242, partial [Rhynchophorus ferrugineus]
MDKKEFR